MIIWLFVACVTGRTVEDGKPDDTADSSGTDGADGGGDTGTRPHDPLEDIDPSTLPAGASPCRPPVLGRVTYVVDGDTAYITTDEGEEDVRFIGVDTPEIAHEGNPADCYGDEAADFTRSALEGKTVWLTFDGECRDYYDRTLAYIHTGDGDGDFYERELLQGGWASTLAIEPNTSFEDLFNEDERDARDAGQGLWSACD